MLEDRTEYFVKNRHLLLNREYLLDIFTVTGGRFLIVHNITGDTDKDPYVTVSLEDDPDNQHRHRDLLNTFYTGRIVEAEVRDGSRQLFGVDHLAKVEDGFTLTLFNFGMKSTDAPIFHMNTTFTLTEGMILNYSGPPVETTCGRFLLNHTILSVPFGDLIPYINDIWTPSKVEKLIIEKVVSGEVSREKFGKYMNNVFFIGHFTQLCVPTLTEKAWTTDPEIKKRKAELLSKYTTEELKNPLIASQIEDELIAMDKEYLKGDLSMGYLIGGKSFNIHRKKMFLTVGSSEAFSDDATQFNFIPNSLAEGWDPKTIPDICNDIRRGSYNRGKATAKGGEETKNLMRVLQNLRIDGVDCGTSRGLNLKLTDLNAKQFIGRTIIDKGKTVSLTKENLSEWIGKDVLLRSPQCCESRFGICYVCIGEIFAKLGMESIGLEAITISSTFLTASLKNMHGSKVTTRNIDDITKFFTGTRN